MEPSIIKQLAAELYEAEKTGEAIATITDKYQLTNDEAYEIQIEGMKLRLADGHRIVGKKIGLTSKAMQNALGVFEPDYGYIADYMMSYEGEPILLSELVAPKVEPEIAFVLKEDLQGPGVTVADVLRATAGIMPAIEIIDSRVKDWKIKIQDTIADGASIGRVVLSGKLTPVDDIDMRFMGLVLEKNGEIVATAAGAAVLGHPANAVAWLANKLAKYNISLKKGEVIMSGSFTAACPVTDGDNVTCYFDHIGSVSARFKK
ncbi:2-hydroxypent-2,4-dienoate hydratase [Sporomusa carbonis]|uniref:2-keto-4-pentenoate hydratase n=1 Tax=Sporomusa carbonis TaxID=3076075 RepID=UPI003A79D942